jgi:outer membrane protein assembly factor BamE (lipoprotein component of BamABCDE complex)
MPMTSARTAMLGLVLSASCLGATGCVAITNERGYVQQDKGKLATIRVGVDTKQSLQANLGSPSVTGTFTDSTWYYISSIQDEQYFFRPEETDRNITAVTFSPDNKVAAVKSYTLADGQEIAMNDRETPARGRELTLLQQIFGNVGKGIPVGTLDQEENDPRNRR